jgi:nucleotide-binding universal stress UspA family protein
MYKRVLVPVDGSEAAEAIVPFIMQIAGPLDLDVVFVLVRQPPPPVAGDGTVLSVENIDAADAVANVYLAELALKMERQGARVETRVRRGRPTDEILAAARDERIDMIAMTTHGRTGPGRLLFGSVAEGVLRHADVPVFLMRQAAAVAR